MAEHYSIIDAVNISLQEISLQGPNIVKFKINKIKLKVKINRIILTVINDISPKK